MNDHLFKDIESLFQPDIGNHTDVILAANQLALQGLAGGWTKEQLVNEAVRSDRASYGTTAAAVALILYHSELGLPLIEAVLETAFELPMLFPGDDRYKQLADKLKKIID